MLYLCRFNVDSEDEHPVVITKSGRNVFVLRILINKWKVKILKKTLFRIGISTVFGQGIQRIPN